MDEDDVNGAIEHAAELLMKHGAFLPVTPSTVSIDRARGIVARFLSECDGSTTVQEIRVIMGVET